MARTRTPALKTVTAQNEFTDHIQIMDNERGYLNVSISGIAGGSIVTLQRAFDSENDTATATWKGVKTYTVDTEEIIEDYEKASAYRLGVKTGEFGSGTTLLRLSQ